MLLTFKTQKANNLIVDFHRSSNSCPYYTDMDQIKVYKRRYKKGHVIMNDMES